MNFGGGSIGKKEIHGNNAKVDKNSKIEPAFIASTVTMSDKKKHETPLVEDSNVAYARKFIEENKK